MNGRNELVERLARKRNHKLGGLSSKAYAELLSAVRDDPERFVDDDAEAAFLQVVRALENLERGRAGDPMRDDDEFAAEADRRRSQLADDCRRALETDPGCADARLVLAMATKPEPDDLLDTLIELNYALKGAPGPDLGADPGAAPSHDAGGLAATDAWNDPLYRPILRVRAATARTCLDTARIGMARDLSRGVLDETPADALGCRYTLALAYARLEDEDAFDALDAEYSRRGNAWFSLGRTLLLYKLDRLPAAGRALKGICSLYEGGAYAVLRPTYVYDYVPDRPDFALGSYQEITMAVKEADPLLVDAPDFFSWAESRPGVVEQAKAFADAQGLDF